MKQSYQSSTKMRHLVDGHVLGEFSKSGALKFPETASTSWISIKMVGIVRETIPENCIMESCPFCDSNSGDLQCR